MIIGNKSKNLGELLEASMENETVQRPQQLEVIKERADRRSNLQAKEKGGSQCANQVSSSATK